MQAFRRSAVRTAQSFGRQQRRWAHDAHHDSHAHASSGPSEEHFGTGFWVGISLIPATFAFFQLSGPGQYEQKYWTRVISSYDDQQKQWAAQNDLHAQFMEQAAKDKILFLNSATTRHVDLKFPELLNSGAPWNVPAGSRANVDDAIAKYEKESFEENAKKLQQIKDNNVPIEQPYVRSEIKEIPLV